MKILIIGYQGMLGQALTETFAHANELVLWEKEDLDITREAEVKSKIPAIKPDIVINAAAFNNVDIAEQSQELADAVNGYAVGYLAQAAKELDIPLVHYGTDYIFDGEKAEGYTEADRPNPISAYGRSKLLGESELLKNHSKFYLIRLSRLFGKEAIAPGAKKSFVFRMLDAARSGQPVEVIDAEASSPTFAWDLASQTRYIVENRLPFRIYHSSNSGSTTWYGFAKEIFEILRLDVNIKVVPENYFARPARRPKYSVLLNTKLPQMRSWQDALKEFLTSSK